MEPIQQIRGSGIVPESFINQETWSSFEDLGDGIYVYRDIIPNSLNLIERLENILQNNDRYSWREAFVGYQQRMPDYRDCMDFKFKKTDIAHDTSEASIKLQEIWQECFDRKKIAVDHYEKQFRLGKLRYWEAMNFIKYGPGQHFQEHHDHGYSYNCTVSLVSYINDDYEGGELYFRLQDKMIKPRAGDLYIFPSNYMYPHRAMPVHSGVKYSIVTMLDYSSKFHTPEMYQETGD
jgi:Rps23 Pro-64 3,4-dihydroxylase Tpa1-like proline 4-hydroxylase